MPGSHPSKPWEASKVSAAVTEEHLEDLRRIDTHATHVIAIEGEPHILAHVSSTEVHIFEGRGSLIAIELDVSAIVSLFLLGVSQDTMCLGNILEFLGGLLLLNITLASISIRMVFEGKSLVRLLDLCLSGSSRDAEDGVVILLSCLSLFLLGLLYLGLHVGGRVKLLDLAVVIQGRRVILSLHVKLRPSDE